MTEPDATRAAQLVRATELAAEQGLKFVYAGNAPGRVGRWENTWCPGCGEKLIDRFGYLIREFRLTADGRCPRCQQKIPGIWHSNVRTGHTAADYFSRFPRPVRL
jgi:pyruvate formate lyase activating enzyme